MRNAIPHTERAGLLLALAAALVSGVAVFTNGFAVTLAPGPVAFTTAKNLVAALVVMAALLATPARTRTLPALRALRPVQWLALGYVAVISGAAAFGLFFTGLVQSGATEAAFAQKSLVIWVALIAVPFLHERLGGGAAVAIAALVAGQVLLTLGAGPGKPGTATASALVLAATLLWAMEILLVRRLLRDLPAALLASIRLGAGSLVLLGWMAGTGTLPQLAGMAGMWGWTVATGLLLSGYVLTWFGALRRAQAIDVTAVLVLGAFVTAALSLPTAAVVGAAQLAGMLLIAGGVAALLLDRLRRTDPVPA